MAEAASNLATLELGGEKYNVIHTSFEAMKAVDDQNRATSFVKQASAKFVLEGTDKASKVFEKFSNSRKRDDATCTLYNTHEDGELAKVEFKEASITYYASNYDASSNTPYTITIVLSPKEINYGSGKLAFNQNT